MMIGKEVRFVYWNTVGRWTVGDGRIISMDAETTCVLDDDDNAVRFIETNNVFSGFDGKGADPAIDRLHELQRA